MVGAITETWSFQKLVELSGYRNVVTTNAPPSALVHDGIGDERIITDGVAAYFVSRQGLALEPTERARQLLQRLHDLGDWAAGEIVERRRRDEERLASGYHDQKPRLTVHQMFVRRYVKRHPGSTVEGISFGVSLPASDVLALSASEEARYRELDD